MTLLLVLDLVFCQGANVGDVLLERLASSEFSQAPSTELVSSARMDQMVQKRLQDV